MSLKKKTVTYEKYGTQIIKRLCDEAPLHLIGIRHSVIDLVDTEMELMRMSAGYSNHKHCNSKDALEHDVNLKRKNVYDLAWSRFVEVDPSPDKQCKYVPWVVSRYVNGGIPMWEDLDRAHCALDEYYDMSKRRVFQNNEDLKQYADVNTFKTLAELEATIRKINKVGMDMGAADQRFVDNVQKFHESGDIEIIWQSDDKQQSVLKLNTVEASTELFSQRASWCTAPKGNQYFSNYSQQGPLYTFTDLGEDWYYQLHIPSHQFMDKNDCSVHIGSVRIPYSMMAHYINNVLGVRYEYLDDDNTISVLFGLLYSNDFYNMYNKLRHSLDENLTIGIIKDIYSHLYPDICLDNIPVPLSVAMIKYNFSPTRSLLSDIYFMGRTIPEISHMIKSTVCKTMLVPDGYDVSEADYRRLQHVYLQNLSNIDKGLEEIFDGDISGVYGEILIKNNQTPFDDTPDATRAFKAHYIRHKCYLITGERFMEAIRGDDFEDMYYTTHVTDFMATIGRRNPCVIEEVTDPDFGRALFETSFAWSNNIFNELIANFSPHHPDWVRLAVTYAQNVYDITDPTIANELLIADLTNSFDALAVKWSNGNRPMIVDVKIREALSKEFRRECGHYVVGHEFEPHGWNEILYYMSSNVWLNSDVCSDLLINRSVPETHYFDMCWEDFAPVHDLIRYAGGSDILQILREDIMDDDDYGDLFMSLYGTCEDTNWPLEDFDKVARFAFDFDFCSFRTEIIRAHSEVASCGPMIDDYERELIEYLKSGKMLIHVEISGMIENQVIQSLPVVMKSFDINFSLSEDIDVSKGHSIGKWLYTFDSSNFDEMANNDLMLRHWLANGGHTSVDALEPFAPDFPTLNMNIIMNDDYKKWFEAIWSAR